MPLRDRLREMEFELPLAGGDLRPRHRPPRSTSLGDLAPLLRRHLPEGDPVRALRRRARRTRCSAASALRGYLTGSVDVVLRLPGPRYVVVDYKTNWLGPRDEPLTAHAYRPAALDAAMGHSDYPLQALLLRRRAAPLPALAPARLRPGDRTSAACSTSTCAACAGRRPRWSTASPAASSPGGRRWPLVEELSDLLDGTGAER